MNKFSKNASKLTRLSLCDYRHFSTFGIVLKKPTSYPYFRLRKLGFKDFEDVISIEDFLVGHLVHNRKSVLFCC